MGREEGMKKNKSSIFPYKTFLLILCFGILFFFGVTYAKRFTKHNDISSSQDSNPKVTESPIVPVDYQNINELSLIDTTNWETHSINNVVSFKYPANFSISFGPPGTVFIRKPKTYMSAGPEEFVIDAGFRDYLADYDTAVAKIEPLPGQRIQTADMLKFIWPIDYVYAQDQRRTDICAQSWIRSGKGAISIRYCEPEEGPRVFQKIESTLEFVKK